MKTKNLLSMIVVFFIIFSNINAQNLKKNQENNEYTASSEIVVDTLTSKTAIIKASQWLNTKQEVNIIFKSNDSISCKYEIKPQRICGYNTLIGFDMNVYVDKNTWLLQPNTIIKLDYNNFYYGTTNELDNDSEEINYKFDYVDKHTWLSQPNRIIKLNYDNFYYRKTSELNIIKFNSKYFSKRYDKKLKENVIIKTNTELSRINEKLSFITTINNNQTNNYTQEVNSIDKRDLYMEKIESYSNMRNTGTGLTVFGVVGEIGGIYLYRSGLNGIENGGSIHDLTKNTNNALLGICLMTGGSAMLITGLVLNGVGGNKMREYQNKLNKLNIGGYIAPNQKGFSLSYQF
jgi:hypothetical protein